MRRCLGTGGLVAGQRFDHLGDCRAGPNECGAATGDNSLFDGRTGRRQGVFDAVLLLFELDLGRSTDLHDGNAAAELGETLLELLAIPVAESVLSISALDLADPAFDVGLLAGAVDDRGVVLGHDDAAGTEPSMSTGHVVELEPDLFGDNLATGEDRHVLEHGLAALTEAGGLDGHRVEGATDLVHDEGCQGFALDILGDDQQRLAGLHDLFEYREGCPCTDADLALVEQDVGLVEYTASGARDR